MLPFERYRECPGVETGKDYMQVLEETSYSVTPGVVWPIDSNLPLALRLWLDACYEELADL